jgi:hypothetical protein
LFLVVSDVAKLPVTRGDEFLCRHCLKSFDRCDQSALDTSGGPGWIAVGAARRLWDHFMDRAEL